MRIRSVAVACVLVPSFLIACGARGPLDDFASNSSPSNGNGSPNGSSQPGSSTGSSPGSSTGSSPGNPGSPGTSPGSTGSADAGSPSTGPVPLPIPLPPGLADAGGILGCGACVASQCGSQIQTCLADPTCSQTLQCIATTCLGGLGGLGGGGGGGGGGTGGGGPGCFLTCGGGLSGIGALLPILTCIGGTCGSTCGSLLGGLGGLGGGGGGGGGGLPGGGMPVVHPVEDAPPPPYAGRIIFSAFPQVCGAE